MQDMLADQDQTISKTPPALSAAQILANIRDIQAPLQAAGREIEIAGRLPDEVVRLLRQSGAFRMMMPLAWGGPQMNPMQINEALEALAIGSGAAAWCAMIQMDSGLYSGLLPAGVAREIYADVDVTTSNVIRGAGRARRVEGGYLVSGRWPFASGCRHADWFAGGCHIYEQDETRPVFDDKGMPVHRMMMVRRESLLIHETWDTIGLRGTGSNDVELKSFFVPDAHSFSFETASQHTGALYQWAPMLVAKMPGVALGIARQAIDSTLQMFRTRLVRGEHVALAVADAQTAYASSRAYVYQSLQALWQRLEAGQAPTEAERAAVYLARANAFQSARSAVQTLFDAVGAPAVYGAKSPLERHLRDLNTACQHTFGQRKAQISAGELLLGALEKPVMFL